MENEKQKLTQKTWFVITMLILFFPVGLYLMWKNNKFNKTARIIISVFFALILLGNLATSKNTTAVSSQSAKESLSIEEESSAWDMEESNKKKIEDINKNIDSIKESASEIANDDEVKEAKENMEKKFKKAFGSIAKEE